jgi:hypothetical protein
MKRSRTITVRAAVEGALVIGEGELARLVSRRAVPIRDAVQLDVAAPTGDESLKCQNRRRLHLFIKLQCSGAKNTNLV